MSIHHAVAALVSLFVLAGAEAHGQSEPTSSGTGFFINSEGWLITNAHVVEGCSRVQIVGRGDAAEWKSDRLNDVAAVRSAGAAPTPLVLRQPPPRLGEDVAALGFPLATLLSSSIKITTGNINSLLGMGDDTRYLQISTPVQPGNSGGPLVDHTGAMVGVITSVLKSDAAGQSVVPQNVNFALRGSVIEAFLQSRGIEYKVAAETSESLTTADLAEKVAPSVVQLLCFGSPPLPVAPAQSVERNSPVAVEPYRPFSHFDNQDVIGFDYGTLRGVSPDQCLAACKDDARCRAVTYNKKAQYCFLKDNAILTVRNGDAIGAVATDLASEVYQTTFSVFSGKDQPGGDYLRIRQSTFVACFAECGKDNRCRAFAYIRKKNECWLKDRIGWTENRPGVDLGIK